MTRYQAIVGYDGTAYSGWQRQPKVSTIQETIEKVLLRLTGQNITITGAGRTDAGVHAVGQCFHFDSDKELKNYTASINALLPDDIFLYDCQPTAGNFHARFDARWKEYEYRLCDGWYNPNQRNNILFVAEQLNEKAMAKAATAFIGYHDFTSYNATSLAEQSNQKRTIFDIQIIRRNDEVICRYWGDAFLQHQIRMMTAALIEASRGNFTATTISDQLAACSKTATSLNLPPRGLYLMEVGYHQWQQE